MDAEKKQLLEEAGIDVEDALSRFMGNEPLMMKFLLRFPQDETFALLRQALACQDAPRAFEAAHTLKGTTGNLSMAELFRLLSPMVEDLRGGDLPSAQNKMPALEEKYHLVLDALSRLS